MARQAGDDTLQTLLDEITSMGEVMAELRRQAANESRRANVAENRVKQLESQYSSTASSAGGQPGPSK